MYSEITDGVVGGTEQARSGYKKREGAPPRLGAGRLWGLLADAGRSGRRRCKEGGPPPGLVVLSVASGAAGRWSAGGGLLCGGCWFAGDGWGGQ